MAKDWRRRLFLVEPLLAPSALSYQEIAPPEPPRRCECEENGGPCWCWVDEDDEGYE